MQVLLNVTAGPHKGQSFRFREHDTFIVGRSESAQFRLPLKDKSLSRIHFMVEVNPPQCRLMDMASTNGTFVNGQRVTTIDLKDGDKIRGGMTLIRVQFDDADEPEPAPDFDPPTRPVQWGNATNSLTVPIVPTPPFAPRGEFPSLPKLTIEAKIGEGGMGVVYRAKTPSGETVAVKTITPAQAGDSSTTARFLREAAILRTLDHPRIVKFREVGHADGLLYFVMDFVPGHDAEEEVQQKSPLPIGQAVGMAIQILEALAFAHDRGFVHRDVKPRNLMVMPDGGVKLADFGLARIYLNSPLSGLTITGQAAGTYGYMPPEQLTNFRDAKPQADLYAAGATLYYLLTGKRVYDLPVDPIKQLLMILQDEPRPIRERRQDIPEGLAEVIHKALRREPDERYVNAEAMKAALKPFS